MSSDRVLTQDEIDDLLEAVSSGEVETNELKEKEEHNVEVYDFKHPNKLSKDQLRTLRMIYEGFGRLVSTAISTQLRTMGKIELASIEQLSYDEFIRSLPQPTVMSICDFNPFHGEFIIEMNPRVAFAIVERTFGGAGNLADGAIREFTDIEEVVLKKITKRFLESLSEAWENVADLRPRLKELESNPQFTQIVPGNDMVILATFNTHIGSTEGLINICIPYIVLEPIVSKLSAQYWFSAARNESNEESLDQLKKGLGKAHLPIEVELGRTNIKVAELLELNEGDVLRLDTKADEDLVIKVNDRQKFTGKPGKLGSKLAAEIINAISEEEWEGESNG
ncbi:flagellar motor switch protein FliM [Halobacteroides halobius DSM 5150]|uniref:Flagellar motor switch protein FliM n=1 Tax=Halobacteroides halobius (strain ATCC 35273 / DSM 5150 / MD-1) TaxID=748449 RepID=L0K8E1_HALHC|nr:flagellar motor switch protein FliM [Halobacteroides halobius]AGB40639.1 flagellar motor switch protein FliM [Halobacteroides halobius DSM 5150]